MCSLTYEYTTTTACMLVWCICCVLIGVDFNTFLVKAMERFNTFFTEAIERFNTSTYESTYTVDDKPCKIFIKIKKRNKNLVNL